MVHANCMGVPAGWGCFHTGLIYLCFGVIQGFRWPLRDFVTLIGICHTIKLQTQLTLYGFKPK